MKAGSTYPRYSEGRSGDCADRDSFSSYLGSFDHGHILIETAIHSLCITKRDKDHSEYDY